MVLLLLVLQALVVSPKAANFVHTTCKIDYYDKFLEKNVQVVVEIYCPTKDIESNGHLVMIANGAGVPAKEYSYLSEQLSSRGYFVVTADFKIFVPQQDRTASYPNMDVLHTLLKQLIQDNIYLPNLNFKDVIILGHSFGGHLSIADAADRILHLNVTNIIENIPDFFPDERNFEEKLEQMETTINLLKQISNFFPDEKKEFWDEYVKGAIVFEGWLEQRLLVPQKNKFLVMTGSQYYKKLLQAQQNSLTEEERNEINFYVFYNANHYLINNFYGPEPVSPGHIASLGQANFTTTYEEWQKGQDVFVQLLDYEIQKKLAYSKKQYNKVQKRLQAVLESAQIEKL